ncbi:hypothetical protein Pint_29949 [Pistacia integerrima]|uniref:Uncharacterized protein n=1 Tax=Pistacia integerrima TaxID=434235 RepID=A0ACC0X2S9_9ROSI|nr:hypothetical protein Pint_29949 [Pistacia integerrima]
MRTVRNTIDIGRTIVCTIHQPIIDIFGAIPIEARRARDICGAIGSPFMSSGQLFSGHEVALGIDFAELYKKSDLYKQALSNLEKYIDTYYSSNEDNVLGSWLQEHRAKQQDLFNSMGSMYSAVLFLIQNASSMRPGSDHRATAFYRKRVAGMYSALPYALA